MVLAKLIAGCPIDVKHSCSKCLKEKNRQVNSLFSALRQISPKPNDADVERYRRKQRLQQIHRDFLQVRKDYGRRRTIAWYSKQLDVSEYTIREWWRVEDSKRDKRSKPVKRAKSVPAKPSAVEAATLTKQALY